MTGTPKAKSGEMGAVEGGNRIAMSTSKYESWVSQWLEVGFRVGRSYMRLLMGRRCWPD